ncbi:MAG: hypothetical protein ABR987_21220 [Terracidiphilus sp.]|jgi:hypothetical protein
MDRTSSKRLIGILRMAGLRLQTIYELYPNEAHRLTRDPDWIKQCGENNWIVITGDKRIETVPENRQAVIEAKARVFLLNDSNTKPEVWAAAILLGQYKMQDILDATTGPFFVTIGKRCDTHVARPRRPRGYEEQASLPESTGVSETNQAEAVPAETVPPNTSAPKLPFPNLETP